jgi:acetolactate synthase-1/2/3 large subunit
MKIGRMGDPRIQVPSSHGVANLLLDYLKLEGVDVIFGIPGGALISVLCALKDRNVQFRFVVCRHESGAAFAADGHARAGGKLGIVLTTSGPAGTNALTGTMNAQAAGSSLLRITVEMAQKYVGRGYLQEGLDSELDVVGVYRHAVG